MFCLVNHIYRGVLGKKDPKNPKKVVGYLILGHSAVSSPNRSRLIACPVQQSIRTAWPKLRRKWPQALLTVNIHLFGSHFLAEPFRHKFLLRFLFHFSSEPKPYIKLRHSHITSATLQLVFDEFFTTQWSSIKATVFAQNYLNGWFKKNIFLLQRDLQLTSS